MRQNFGNGNKSDASLEFTGFLGYGRVPKLPSFNVSASALCLTVS